MRGNSRNPITAMTTRLLSAALLVTGLSARAQLTLTQIGGTIGAGNYATLGSTAAFGLDEIGGGGFPIHKIPNVRDSTYGNPNSWIGDSLKWRIPALPSA